ncbi:MAG: CDP-alcohol phosphatidyltransferase family protein [Bacteroidota bacterium]|nr:CDP-alcohol phosphatidyltransferase family protein [Bacteroidota bacterium]
MSFIKRNIPNAITCGNLLCGCLAIVKAFEGDLVWAAYLVGIAAVLDFFDGFAARLLKVSSPIGKDLDSLADMVTFGVVPGVVMFQMLRFSILGGLTFFEIKPSTPYLNFIPYIAFIIPIFSAIRLAKFNNDTRQSDSFIGVPTPANAILICSLTFNALYVYSVDQPISDDLTIRSSANSVLLGSFTESFFMKYILNKYSLITLTLIMSFLLVAELPLIALKFKNFKWKGNEIRFIFLGGAVVLLATLQLVGIPLVIVFYILISIINNLLNKKKTT